MAVPWSARFGLSEPWRCSSRIRTTSWSRSHRPFSFKSWNWAWGLKTRVGQMNRRASRELWGCRPTMKKAVSAKLNPKWGSSGSRLTVGVPLVEGCVELVQEAELDPEQPLELALIDRDRLAEHGHEGHELAVGRLLGLASEREEVAGESGRRADATQGVVNAESVGLVHHGALGTHARELGVQHEAPERPYGGRREQVRRVIRVRKQDGAATFGPVISTVTSGQLTVERIREAGGPTVALHQVMRSGMLGRFRAQFHGKFHRLRVTESRKRTSWRRGPPDRTADFGRKSDPRSPL